MYDIYIILYNGVYVSELINEKNQMSILPRPLLVLPLLSQRKRRKKLSHTKTPTRTHANTHIRTYTHANTKSHAYRENRALFQEKSKLITFRDARPRRKFNERDKLKGNRTYPRSLIVFRSFPKGSRSASRSVFSSSFLLLSIFILISYLKCISSPSYRRPSLHVTAFPKCIYSRYVFFPFSSRFLRRRRNATSLARLLSWKTGRKVFLSSLERRWSYFF